MKLYAFITLFAFCLFTAIEARRLIVIRHGEKISDDYIGLNNKGKARANCLYQVFNQNTEFGKPQSIYSNKRGNRSHRPYDTVKPLADRYGLTVKEFSKYDVKEFVKNTLNKDTSSNILLSSAREWIPSLLDALGYYIDPDSVDDFDNVWVINNDDKRGHGKLTIKKQKIESCINYYLNGNVNAKLANKKTTKRTTKKTTTKTTKRTTKKTTKKNTTTLKKASNQLKVSTNYRCGPKFNTRCPANYCCSKHGYCGQKSDYCKVGCQPKYGICK